MRLFSKNSLFSVKFSPKSSFKCESLLDAVLHFVFLGLIFLGIIGEISSEIIAFY